MLKNEINIKTEKLLADLNEPERKIYETIEYELMHIDKINELTGLSVSECLVHLLSLEFKGYIRESPGKNFIKT